MLKLHKGLPHEYEGLTPLSRLPLLPQAHQQGASLEVEQLGLQPAPFGTLL